MNSESYILRMHGRCKILGVARGWLGIPFGDLTVTVVAGQFCLLPAPLGKISVQGHGAVFLEVTPG